jgi:hypothetical protein
MPTIKVRLNGTNKNSWHKMGLKQNPFPQLGKAEYDAGERQINSLDGDPIKDANDIRQRLKGFSEEFIEGCVARFKPGKRVEFLVNFPER